MKKSGLFWHVHHDVLAEWSDNIDERIEYIKNNKPANEIKLRLKLLKPIILPKQKAYADWQKADADWRKADADRRKAYADWRKAGADRQKADADWRKADADRRKADADWQKAGADWRKADQNISPQLEKLHKKQCPHCPWNGETIFPKKPDL